MADNFGLKIGVEGEKEFKKALADINQSFKVLGSEMKLATSQFDKNESSVESLTAKNEVLTKQIDAQKGKIETLRSALQNASDSFGENDRRTQQWVVALNNAEAELNGMERELKDNEQAIDKMGDESADAAKQTDKLGDEIEDTAKEADASGGKFEKLGSIVKGVGVAMGAALAAIGTAAIAAGKALVDMTVEAAAYADDMLTQSTVTGMSVESLQAYSYAADLVDVSLDTLTGSMAKNVKSMSNAAQGSAKYAEAYDKLGVSVTNADGTLRDSEEVYWEVIDALGQISNETERDALAMQLFGKSAQDLNPLIEMGSEGIRELTEEARAMGAILPQSAIEALGVFDDSVQRLKAVGTAAKHVLGTILLPQMQAFTDGTVSILADFNNGMIAAAGDFDQISVVLGNAIGGFADLLLTNLPDILQVVFDMVGAIGSAIMNNMDTIVACAGEIVSQLLAGIIQCLPGLAEGAAQLVVYLVQAIVDNLPALVEAAVLMVASLIEGLGQALPELIPAIVEAVLLIVQTLFDNMDLLIEAGGELLKGIILGIINSIPVLIEHLPQVILSIVQYFASERGMFLKVGIDLLEAIIVGILNMIPNALAAIGNLVSGILGRLGILPGEGHSVGLGLIQGIWDGFVSKVAEVMAGIAQKAREIAQAIRNALNIHSPSKLTISDGENLALGLGVGFLNAIEAVKKDIRNALPTDFGVSLGNASALPQTAMAGAGIQSVVQHTGVIRVEGVDSEGALNGVVDIILEELRAEVRAYGTA